MPSKRNIMAFRAPISVLAGTRYRLPKVACSTPPKINPEYPLIYEDNAAWVRKFLPFASMDAMLPMLECCYPMWDSLVYPVGIAERVLHSSCVTSLMFEVDDLALLELAFFEDLTPASIAGHAYGPAFADIFGTLKREMPEGVWQRYRASWQGWFGYVVQETKLRKGLLIPDVRTYTEIRRGSIGLLPSTITAEYVLGQDLTSVLAADPELARLSDLVSEHAMFVNDLFSFRREFFKGDNFNVLASLLHAEGHTLQRAVEITCEKVQAADDALVSSSNALRRRYADPSIHAYIDALNSFCAGNLRWSLETKRYIGRGNAWNGLRTGVVTLHQDRTSIASE